METIKEYESFDDMGLDDDILRGVYSNGFEKPSAIQSKGIVPIIKGHDCISQSQSGTGKTGTFTIGALQKVDLKKGEHQVIILSPTRELSYQIYNVITAFAKFTDINIETCIGGENLTECRNKLNNPERPVHVIVGTPGRITDFLQRGHINNKNLTTLILDEADECLSQGFKDQLYNIFQQLPEDIQVVLFSATMPPEMLELTEKFMRNPQKILVNKEELTLEGIKQFYIDCGDNRYKYDVLCDLYSAISISQCIIYVNSRRQLEWLYHRLTENNFSVSYIHGQMTTQERYEFMREFRLGNTRILLSTDLLSRGIDIQQLSLVINYDLPLDFESYIHRIGRSGRHGRKGVAINFVSPRDMNKLTKLQEYYQTQINELPTDFSKYM